MNNRITTIIDFYLVIINKKNCDMPSYFLFNK